MSARKSNLSIEWQLKNRVRVDEVTGCWNWNASKSSGYGMIQVDKKRIGAHRLAYITFVGPIPLGHFVCHRCDNPGCINPEHLFTGTARENMRDMVQKGRDKHGETAGEKNGRHKLTKDQVMEIRVLLERRELRHGQIAALFKVSRSTVSMINTNRQWATEARNA